MILGFILMSAALIWLVTAKTPRMLFGMACIFGVAYGGCAVSHSPLIVDLFGLRSHGSIFGVFNLSVMSGGAIGPLLTGYLFDVTDSYQLAFILCAVISLMGVTLAAFLRLSRVSGANM